LKTAAHLSVYVRPTFAILKLPEGGLEEELWGSMEELSDRSAEFTVDLDDHG